MATKKVTKKEVVKKVSKPKGFGFPFKVRVVITNLVKGQVMEKAVKFTSEDNLNKSVDEVVKEVLK